MKKEVKAAAYEWAAGLIIGLTPLATHLVLHLFAKPASHWEDSWAGDILFVSITNSGLSGVTVFIRMAKGTFKTGEISPGASVAMAGTFVTFLLAALLYGLVASGHSFDNTIIGSIIVLLSSGMVSLYFEMILAAHAVPLDDGSAH